MNPRRQRVAEIAVFTVMVLLLLGLWAMLTVRVFNGP